MKSSRVTSINIGKPVITKVIESLNYSPYFDEVNSFNSIKRIPSSIRLDHNWFDTCSHFIIGEWLIFGTSFYAAFTDFSSTSSSILVVFGILAFFFLMIPWVRKSSWMKMELLETEFSVSSYRFKWENIEEIYKIQTTDRYPKYGVRLILKDKTEVNIDLAQRVPSFGHESEMFHYIYIFWKRALHICNSKVEA